MKASRWAAIALTSAVLLMHASAQAATQWAVDPAQPGPNLPPAGRSLFDQIAADGVPFPFEALVRKIEARSCAENRCTPAVLIPLGRSLQRTAAAPDFFSSPRVVVAVTGEGRGPVHAKDRLYLGYQERAQLIEVISYNEAAARFEFQLVRNYAPGKQPEIVYAERAVCTSCHQNQAPIFSRQVWDETNANPRVADRLSSSTRRAQLYGVPIRRGIDLPNAIDDSTDRANTFGLTQRIWRDACDPKCRGRALTAALQYRLSDEQDFDAAPVIGASFKARWPDGLAMPSPDVPNRDPFSTAGAIGADEVDIPGALEALMPRAPLAVWHADSALDARFVAAFASMIAQADLQDLDARLQRSAAKAQRRVYTARCTPRGDRHFCTGDFELEGTASTIDRLKLNGRSLGRISVRDGRAIRHGRAVRSATGDRIERVQLPAAGAAGNATLTVVEDFAPTREAIAASVWADAPVTRKQLRSVLGLAPIAEPALAHSPSLDMPPTASALPPMAASFMAPCGACHRSSEKSPPNFLAGDAARVKASLKHCAPRMFVRLSMWQQPAASRAKVPMPPPRASHDGSPAIQHEADAGIAELRTTVAEWLRVEDGKAPDAAAMLARGYENLRPCLAASN